MRGNGFAGGGATAKVPIAAAWTPSASRVATRTSRWPVAPKRMTRVQSLPETMVSGGLIDQVIVVHIAVGLASLRSVTIVLITKFSFCCGVPLLWNAIAGAEFNTRMLLVALTACVP